MNPVVEMEEQNPHCTRRFCTAVLLFRRRVGSHRALAGRRLPSSSIVRRPGRGTVGGAHGVQSGTLRSDPVQAPRARAGSNRVDDGG